MSAEPEPAAPRAKVDRALSLVLLLLVAYRLAYHASYLGEVPFAHATFADGAVYEQAARDILADPPLGTAPFYLQGAYAYLLAIGMAVRAWPSLGLLVQLVLAFVGLWVFHRAATRLWGWRAGAIASVALLGHPILAFYENKYLSAELGVFANVLTFAAFVGLLGATAPRRRLLLALGLGAASGLAILARPNMVLAVPFTLMAVLAWAGEGQSRRAARLRASTGPIAALVFGLVVALAPMAARNLAVTGHPDVQPVHGGGTSFFIGNNPTSKGVWNNAGMLTAQLGTESDEFAAALAIDPGLDDRDRARAIGEALYARAIAWIRENPGDWLALEARKLWLVIGDQPLTQDYDWLGERELLPWAHRVGISFSLLLALGLLGAAATWGPGRAPDPAASEGRLTTPARRRALAWLLAGQLLAPLAANLLFFTSAQHRLPLALPLALVAGPGVLGLAATFRSWRARSPATTPLGKPVLIAAMLLLAQGPWPRTRATGPGPVHYYNLAVVQDSIGEPLAALAALDRAIALRPDQPIFLGRRAHLRVRVADFDGAAEDLAAIHALAKQHPVPEWVLAQARLDALSVAHARAAAAELKN